MAAAAVLALVGGTLSAAPASAQTATSDTSPVNISQNIDMAAGKAAHKAIVVAGDARFEVLTPEVVRMEYSPTGSFLDSPTFDIVDRDFTPPPYTTSVRNGWLTLSTSSLVLRYRLGSGPFGPTNTQVRLLGAVPPGATSDVSPGWEWECAFGQACQSGAAALTGGATIADDHQNYTSPPGFVAGMTATGATASWTVLGAPAGPASVAIRYANYIGGIGGPAPRTVSLVVDGTATQVTLPATASWDDWATVTAPVTLTAGTNTVAVSCGAQNDCNVNVDSIAVTPANSTAAAAPFLPASPLGGYIRSYDSVNGSYSASPTCSAGQFSSTCDASIPQMAQGLLDKSGWYLLDDTQTAVWSSDGWLAPRPAGDVEDGYLFGYGQNFARALSDLAKLTGPAPLLPESAFGNWFSRYYPYSASDYEDTLLPEFAANGVTLDDLSVDTDWKSPNQWDGWEWNPALFPDPPAFLAWVKSQDLNVALNVHASISSNDPLYGQAQDIAGGTLQTQADCSSGTSCANWDWGNVAQAESYFATAQPTLGSVAMTWLDWCCDNSYVSTSGVTPDSWINHLIAQQMVDGGTRGFDLSRIGASLENSQAGAYPSGPWADHRSAIAFTGDTWSSWNTLASEAQLAPDEASIGEPYVSNDIGGFLGQPSGGANDDDDLYLRWLQLGTFQPIMREHSNAGQNARLPWEYDSATQAVGDQFMQLRSELVPYLYTLADQASTTGLPMTRPLYLDYPSQAAAYANPTEYLLGPDMLVAPVTTPGTVAASQVWFPPGSWVDWFTGATFTGPATATLDTPTSRMPVFVKAGGVVPLQPSTSHASAAGSAPLTLRVFAGGSGSSTVYDDAGQGLGYQKGQSATTPIRYSQSPNGAASTLTVGPASGSYPGEPSSRSYTVDLVDVTQPASVLVDGRPLRASDWSYDRGTDTLQVALPATAVGKPVTVTQLGGRPVQLNEPSATPTPAPAISAVTPSSAAAGQQVTVTGSGFGASQGSSYLVFSDAGTNWGAPPDLATFQVDSWSDTAITFTVPEPSGSAGQWAVVPGTTASILVTANGLTSNTATLDITS